MIIIIIITTATTSIDIHVINRDINGQNKLSKPRLNAFTLTNRPRGYET